MHSIFPLPHSVKALIVGAGAFNLGGGIGQASELGDQRPVPERIGDFALVAEPGFALPLTQPQSGLFKTGGAQTLKALWVVNEQMNVGPSATFLGLPSKASHGAATTAWTFGGGVRFRFFRNSPDTLFGMSPWVDADALYIRSEGAARLGIAAAAGWAIPIGRAHTFWLGPFARYLQIIQKDGPAVDGRDTRLLSLGLSVEAGFGAKRDRAVAPGREGVLDKEEATTCPVRGGAGVPDRGFRLQGDPSFAHCQ